MIREFFKTTQFRYEQIVRFIRMNDDQTLKIQYENFIKMREISTKRFVSYTSAQNDKIERSEEILMIKIKAMWISFHLSTNLWLEVIKTMNYSNNWISKKKLAWKISFEVLIEKKSKLSHLQSYECRVYSLKNLISRKKKLKSRFFIEYLVRYDSINIFRIWISSHMRVIRIRDVIFDKTRFYDSAEIDSSHLLITIVKNIVKVLKVSNNIFFEVMIQKKNDCDEYVDHLKNESVEEEADQSNKSKNLQIDLK